LNFPTLPPFLATILACLFLPLGLFSQVSDGSNFKEETSGWTDEGFVLVGDTLHYIIHFQNVSGAEVDSVTIVDGLGFPLTPSSIHDVEASHPFDFDLDIDGVLTITMVDLALADSSVDLSASQGFVSFKMSFSPFLTEGDIIENRAQIFFDDNDPIETNFARNEIFGCEGLAAFEFEGGVCEGDTLSFYSSAEYVVDQAWVFEGILFATEDSAFNITPPNVGPYMVTHFASNPLCEVSETSSFEIAGPPQPIIDFVGDSLIASEAGMQPVTYIWLLNGDTLPNAGQSSIDVSQQGGDYEVIAINIFTQCEGQSEVTVVPSDLSENLLTEMSIGPNPCHDYVRIVQTVTPIQGYTLSLLNLYGQVVQTVMLETGHTKLDVRHLDAGPYLITLHDKSGQRLGSKQLIVK